MKVEELMDQWSAEVLAEVSAVRLTNPNRSSKPAYTSLVQFNAAVKWAKDTDVRGRVELYFEEYTRRLGVHDELGDVVDLSNLEVRKALTRRGWLGRVTQGLHKIGEFVASDGERGAVYCFDKSNLRYKVSAAWCDLAVGDTDLTGVVAAGGMFIADDESFAYHDCGGRPL